VKELEDIVVAIQQSVFLVGDRSSQEGIGSYRDVQRILDLDEKATLPEQVPGYVGAALASAMTVLVRRLDGAGCRHDLARSLTHGTEK